MRTFAQQFLNNSDCIAPVPEPYDYTKVAPRVGGGKAEDVGEGGRVQMTPYASAWARELPNRVVLGGLLTCAKVRQRVPLATWWLHGRFGEPLLPAWPGRCHR